MATFQTQLQSLAGAQSSPDTTAMTDWLTSGAREVLNLLPPNKLMRIASTSTFENTRARTKQAALRISNSSNDFGWRLGDLRLEIRPDGKR